MKHLYYLIALMFIFVLVSCNNQTRNNKNNTAVENSIAVLTFEKMNHDFGTITEGEKVIYYFRFTNNGNADLKLTSVGTSCGCTASDYPHNVIKPGETGKIKVTFNSEHRLGMQHKKVTIRANTNPEFTVLDIYAQVIEKNSEN
ncbi:MAG: hypothetical protein DRI74_06165 [Bacteroidetes bacterium]|nr:MAG: hypothetical protein DRI74_06165 [Bacteroidota bacterium]